MDPYILGLMIRRELDARKQEKLRAERWASLTDEQKALEKKEKFFFSYARVHVKRMQQRKIFSLGYHTLCYQKNLY